jgi:hypothetical protein
VFTVPPALIHQRAGQIAGPGCVQCLRLTYFSRSQAKRRPLEVARTPGLAAEIERGAVERGAKLREFSGPVPADVVKQGPRAIREWFAAKKEFVAGITAALNLVNSLPPVAVAAPTGEMTPRVLEFASMLRHAVESAPPEMSDYRREWRRAQGLD